MPFPYDRYPWLNFQELNLAYFIRHFEEIFEQWDHLLADQEAWKTATEQDIEDWKADTLGALDVWKAEAEASIEGWENTTLAALTAWQTAAEAAFEAIRVQAAASATTAAASATAAAADAASAEQARAAAVTAQLAAEEAINGFYLAPRLWGSEDGKIVLFDGGLNPDTGEATTNTAKRRSDYFSCTRPSFRLKVGTDYLVAPFFYNKEGDTYTFLGYIAYKESDSVFSTDLDYNCIRLEFKRKNGATMSASDTQAIKDSCQVLFNTDPSLTIDYAAADAKTTGDAIGDVREMILDDYDIERVFITADGKIDIYNGGLNLDTGNTEASAYKTRSDYIVMPRKKFYMILDAAYLVDLLYYERGPWPPTYIGYIQGVTSGTLVKSEFAANRIRIVFYRKDGVALQDSDKTSIKNSLKILFNTDESLLIPGAAADAAATGAKINPLNGLKYAALGDSITYGFIPRNYSGYPGQLDSYAKITASRLNMTFANYGVNGSTLAYSANDPMSRRWQNLPDDASLITVMGGTNDYRQNIPLGTMADRTDSTFYGALHVVLGGLYKKYMIDQGTSTGKSKHIVVLTPIKLLESSSGTSGGTGILYDLSAWIAAIKEVAAYYSMPCLDFYDLSGINPHLNETIHGTATGYTGYYNPYITDGTHPTQEGAEIMADVLCGFLKTIM